MDEALTIVYRLLKYVPDVLMHFWSSALVALLAFYWTWTISWLLYGLISSPGCLHSIPMNSPLTSKVARSIYLLSWSAALFCVYVLHYTQDVYIWLW